MRVHAGKNRGDETVQMLFNSRYKEEKYSRDTIDDVRITAFLFCFTMFLSSFRFTVQSMGSPTERLNIRHQNTT